MGTGSIPGVKWPGRDADHPLPSSTEIKERVELYLYSPLWAFVTCSVAIFTFTFTVSHFGSIAPNSGSWYQVGISADTKLVYQLIPSWYISWYEVGISADTKLVYQLIPSWYISWYQVGISAPCATVLIINYTNVYVVCTFFGLINIYIYIYIYII